MEVWVQPRASRDEIAGLQGDAIRVRLTAPPVDGEANEALVRFLARRLGVARRAVTLVRGQSGRRKALRIEGLPPEEVRRRLGVADR
ncbi:MAG: DUF167 domain-containing protein [Deferrisomatales bacterium]